MSHECSLLQEFLSAHGARVWHATMNTPMIDQLKFTWECRTAIRANERIQRSMEPWMHNQMVLLRETLSTLVTDVWSFSGMEFTMCHQMTLQWERTTALLANKWPFTAVLVRKKKMRKERNGWLVSVHLKRAFAYIPMKSANGILPVNSWMR